MRNALSTLSTMIDCCIAGLGRVVSYAVLAILFVIILDMVVRALLGRSLVWVTELNAWLQVALVFLGGPYALAKGSFVRVDALYANYSDRTKAIFDSVVTTALFAIFVWTLVKLGADFAIKSFKLGETPVSGGFGAPVWIAKAMLPIGGTLLALAWVAVLIRQWLAVLDPQTDG